MSAITPSILLGVFVQPCMSRELSAGTLETTLDKLSSPITKVSMEMTALLMLSEHCPTCCCKLCIHDMEEDP